MAGAREKFANEPQEPAASQRSAEPKAVSEQPKTIQERYGKDKVLLVCAIVASASLVACIIIPLWTYFAASDVYSKDLALFKNLLIYSAEILLLT